MHIVLVEPNWEYNVLNKDWRNYMNKHYLPIGLLKLGAYYRNLGYSVELVRGDAVCVKKPEIVMITSLFTYWWQAVWDSVKQYRSIFPAAKVIVGGIYASILPDHCYLSGCDEVQIGLVKDVESVLPAYDLMPETNFCVIHASRGCIRKCPFCFTYKLEPSFEPKKSIKHEIIKPIVSFLDNNLLGNPYIINIFKELIAANVQACYCLSGIDAALVTEEIASLMFDAHFSHIRISFDRNDEEKTCEQAITRLEKAGYHREDIYVFALYNFEDNYAIVEMRRLLIEKWGAKIVPQRYIPIPSLSMNFLHPNWSEAECTQFQSNCSKIHTKH